MSTLQFNKLATLYPKKRAIITGAGSGLGLELTKLLLQDGWYILGVDLNTSRLQPLQTTSLSIHELNIIDRKEFKKCIDTFCKQQNGVDILFNNAGVGEGSLFQNYSLENWDWIIDINLKAVIAGTNYVLPYLLERKAGTIVTISSMAGIANLPKMSPYNVTKAAVISLSETLSHELSKTDIRVKCIMPTFFQSSVLQHSKGDSETLQSAQKVVSNAKLSSHEAAILILRNLHTKKETLLFPLSAYLFFYSRKFIPALYRFVIRKLLVK
ncbi:MAG: family NAD(P)-dependent oxidoreductase [Chitinophagaceae bacterium]|nr:family NAD(P)-dependent oxidoreductase [Chitinophagaceae bacterium]